MSAPGTAGPAPAGDGGPPVLVVGAGPVGVTAATMLAGRGVPVLVVERHDDVYPLPRAVHVDDEIRRVLQGLGPHAPLDPIMMPTGGLRLLDARHRTMAEFNRSRPVGEHGHPQANLYDQPVLERWLRERLAEQPSATLLPGHELVDLHQSGGATVTVRLRQVASGKETTREVRAVLGCDGANSLVRDRLGTTLTDLGFAERWLVVDVRSPRALDAWLGVHQVCDPHRAATFMQVGNGRYRFEFRLRDGETADDLMAPERLSRLVLPWTRDVPFEELELLRRAEYTFRARIADRWQDGRIFLLGDAAHLTPPFIGQGLCAGIRDAANLTWKLAEVLAGRLDASVLATYQAERAPHAEDLIRKAILLGRIMTGGSRGTALVRKVALSALCRVPGFTTAALDTVPAPFAAGPLVLRRRSDGRRALTGRLLPQPTVGLDGHAVLLDRVLGDGFAVVTLDRPGPELLAAAAAVGARVVAVGRRGVPGDVTDHTGALTAWLERGGATGIVVRPDRVVLGQDRSRDAGRALAVRLTAWHREHAGRAAAPAPAVVSPPPPRRRPAAAPGGRPAGRTGTARPAAGP